MLRRVLWLMAGLAVLLGFATWFDRSTDPINPTTFERIKPGMTREEVDRAKEILSGHLRGEKGARYLMLPDIRSS